MAAAVRLPASAGADHSGISFSAILRAARSSRWMVLPDTLRPVCRSMMAAFTSARRAPWNSGASRRRISAWAPSASVAAARSVTVSWRTK